MWSEWFWTECADYCMVLNRRIFGISYKSKLRHQIFRFLFFFPLFFELVKPIDEVQPTNWRFYILFKSISVSIVIIKGSGQWNHANCLKVSVPSRNRTRHQHIYRPAFDQLRCLSPYFDLKYFPPGQDKRESLWYLQHFLFVCTHQFSFHPPVVQQLLTFFFFRIVLQILDFTSTSTIGVFFSFSWRSFKQLWCTVVSVTVTVISIRVMDYNHSFEFR